MLAFATLATLYVRYFFIILIALCSFMVGFDLMDNVGKLSDSANLALLYTMYKTFHAIDMMLPISLVFAMIAALVDLIRSNALVAYYALGYSKTRLLLPFVSVATLFITLHIALHATNFARANEFADNLRETSQIIRPTSDLFFVHEGSYVYFANLYPLTKRADNIRIFSFHGDHLAEAISAEEAIYQDDHWNIINAHLLRPPESLEDTKEGIVLEERQKIHSLKDFKPKILDQVYEGKANFTIGDGLDALKLLEHQNVDIGKIKSSMYRIFITPWFALSIIVLLFWMAPVISRFLNLSLFSFIAILGALLVWGVLLMLNQLANNKTLTPEEGVILPIVILFAVSVWRLGNPLRRVRVKSRKN